MTTPDYRAALTQPEPEGPTDEKLMAMFWQGAGLSGAGTGDHILRGLRAVLARLGRSALRPVPVSERLPGPEDCAPWPDEPDCDPWCWAAKNIDGGWEWTQLSIDHFSSDLGRVCRGQGYTHWLLAHALPVPEVTP